MGIGIHRLHIICEKYRGRIRTQMKNIKKRLKILKEHALEDDDKKESHRYPEGGYIKNI